MTTSDCSQVSFDDSDTRRDEMHSTMEAWVEDLVDEVDDAVSSGQFQEWLEVQSHFHDYSYRNTLLITRQCPHATRVAGYRTWQNKFDRHVKKAKARFGSGHRSSQSSAPSAKIRRRTTTEATVVR